MRNSARRWYSLPVRREIQESRSLWEEIFPEDSEAFLDYYDQWKCKDNHMITRHSQGELVSMAHWNPYQIQMGEGEDESRYLVAVATKPALRHRGLMRGILREGMEECQEDEIPFVFLMPADPEIYRPFGFRYFYDRSVMEILHPMQQNWFGSNQVDIRPIRKAEMEAAGHFLNQELGGRFDLYPCRSEDYLLRLAAECASEEGDLEGIFSDGQLIGILSWWGEDEIEVRDLVLKSDWENGEKKSQWMAAFCKKWQRAEKITIVTTGFDGQVQPIIMGRITNMHSFVKHVRAEAAMQLRIHVEDSLIRENSGDFLWKLDTEGSELMRCEDTDEADIGITIEDLFVWLTGYASPETLESLEMSDKGRDGMKRILGMKGAFFTEIV